jgi:hypothetical protein
MGHVSQFMLVSIHVIDIELNHRRVHLRGLRETDGSAMQSFQVCPEIQVVPLNVERLCLADGVPLAGQNLGIRLPVVGVKVLDRASCRLVAQLSARRVGAPPQDVSGDARGRAVEALPAPALPRLIFDK